MKKEKKNFYHRVSLYVEKLQCGKAAVHINHDSWLSMLDLHFSSPYSVMENIFACQYNGLKKKTFI